MQICRIPESDDLATALHKKILEFFTSFTAKSATILRRFFIILRWVGRYIKASVIRLGNFLLFGQTFKVAGNN